MERMPHDIPSMFGEPPMFVPGAGSSREGASIFGIIFTENGAVVDNGSLHGRSAVEAVESNEKQVNREPAPGDVTVF